MKILFVIDSLAGGGAERLVSNLSLEFKKEGHDCSILVLTRKNEKYIDLLNENGIVVDNVPLKYRTHIAKILFINNYIRKGKFDVVHANCFPSTYYCSIAKQLFNRRIHLYMTEHSTYNKRRRYLLLKPIEKKVYAGFNGIISISKSTEINLLHWLNEKKNDRYTMIYNGIKLYDFRQAKRADIKVIDKEYKENNKYICMVGSFSVQKNHLLAVDVLKELPRNYKIIFLGEGPTKDMIREKLDRLKMNSRAIFLGYRKDVAEIIKASDCVIIPSKWEGFGLIAVEAMTCETPVVSVNVPGLGEIIEKYIIRCEPNTTIGLRQNIMMVCEDKDFAKKCIDCGMLIAEAFGIENTAKKYLQVFEGA